VSGSGSGTGLAENPAFDPRAGDQTGPSTKVKEKYLDPDWHNTESGSRRGAQYPAQDPEPDLAENTAFDPRAGDQTGQQSDKVKKSIRIWTSTTQNPDPGAAQCPAQDPEPDWHNTESGSRCGPVFGSGSGIGFSRESGI
jgi:hypothetical protein